jgi:hypothetical protein
MAISSAKSPASKRLNPPQLLQNANPARRHVAAPRDTAVSHPHFALAVARFQENNFSPQRFCHEDLHRTKSAATIREQRKK